jgi:tetratricopeptide (TPR) repeat protein
VRTIIDACYRGLPPEAARLYRVLGALPLARLSVAPAAAGVGLAVEDVSVLFPMLSEASLIQQTGEDSYHFHELVRLHAREMSRGSASEADGVQCADAVVRVERWYLATAIAAATSVRPYRRDRPREVTGLAAPALEFATARTALDWLDGEAPQLLSLARHAASEGRQRTALRIATQMWSLFAHRKYYRIWQEFDLLGVRCARELGDQVGEARMLRRLGLLSTDLGRYDEAVGHLGAASALYERLADRHRQATVINSLGVVSLRRGDPETAVGYLEQALEVHRELGDVRQVALVLVDLGDALIEAGRTEDALERLSSASSQLEDSPDLSSGTRLRMLTGRARGRLGGDTGAAEAELGSAAESMRALSSLRGQAEALGYCGELAERTGSPEDARRFYEQAADLLDRLGTPSSGWLRQRISSLSPLAGQVLSRGPSGSP